WCWTVVLGLGQCFWFACTLSFIGLRAHYAPVAVRLSGMAQGIGYLIAALGPLGVCALHDAAGGWSGPIASVLGVCLIMLGPGLAAGRNRSVGAPTAPLPGTVNTGYSGHT